LIKKTNEEQVFKYEDWRRPSNKPKRRKEIERREKLQGKAAAPVQRAIEKEK
jgi:hypothetical protein